MTQQFPELVCVLNMHFAQRLGGCNPVPAMQSCLMCPSSTASNDSLMQDDPEAQSEELLDLVLEHWDCLTGENQKLWRAIKQEHIRTVQQRQRLQHPMGFAQLAGLQLGKLLLQCLAEETMRVSALALSVCQNVASRGSLLGCSCAMAAMQRLTAAGPTTWPPAPHKHLAVQCVACALQAAPGAAPAPRCRVQGS